MKTILILEDNEERASRIRRAAAQLGPDYDVKVWRDTLSMRAECEAHFPNTALISLDHDLSPCPGAKEDPGTGRHMAQFLGDYLPVCPVIVHSQNGDQAWSMYNELRFAGWTVERAGGSGVDWSESSWLRCARELIAQRADAWRAEWPPDHHDRVIRMQLSLDGLGLGDALGEMLSYQSQKAEKRILENDLPAGPWLRTDDTEMGISLCAVLKSHGFIHQDALAKRFARRFERDPDRGYGSMTRSQLNAIIRGAGWRETAASAFGGQGSMGNGSAMRVAPLGAYFADDLAKCAAQAQASSVVTHTHPEGIAGAIAVAIGAAITCGLAAATDTDRPALFFDSVLQHTPESKVRDGILRAATIPRTTPVSDVARILGNGRLVTAPDTIPFCLWIAAHHSSNFASALAKTISADGDCDTNAAIVGGTVALSVGREGIPADWLTARELVQI